MARPSSWRTPGSIFVFAALLLFALHAAAHEKHAPLPPLDYTPPAPGTYKLHRIMAAPDGRVVDVTGRLRRLEHYTRGKVTLLGFIYTTCVDPEGCPLAYRVFDSLKARILETPGLSSKVRFVTLSFDPARDTPSAMARYAGSRLHEDRRLEWYFLTTRSQSDLLPLVDGFGQDVRYVTSGGGGKATRELSHVLKVFLIDPAGDIREIYTSTFLHPQVVMNDIATLLLEHR